VAEPAVRAGRLSAVRLPREPVALSVAMLYRNRTMPAKVRAFVDHLQSAPMLRSVRSVRTSG
jgi:DNA-binding transcriptional LysR family regulator